MDILGLASELVMAHWEFLYGLTLGASGASIVRLLSENKQIESHQETLLVAVSLVGHLEVAVERLSEELPEEELREVFEAAERRAEEHRIDLQTGHGDDINGVEENIPLRERVLGRLR